MSDTGAGTIESNYMEMVYQKIVEDKHIPIKDSQFLLAKDRSYKLFVLDLEGNIYYQLIADLHQSEYFLQAEGVCSFINVVETMQVQEENLIYVWNFIVSLCEDDDLEEKEEKPGE